MPTIMLSHSNVNVDFDFDPDVCPRCHHYLKPTRLSATTTDIDELNQPGTVLEIAFECTRRKCRHMFIGWYSKNRQRNAMSCEGPFLLRNCLPKNILPPEIFPEIQKISPSFVSIFTQAHSADDSGLDQICGMGYRKALEFVIKDYCIATNPDDEEEIKSKFLGKVIDQHVDDAKIKACAKLAAWLGNDETHYVKKWVEKDVEDLKVLIDLTCMWIRGNILTEQYLEDMKKSKNRGSSD